MSKVALNVLLVCLLTLVWTLPTSPNAHLVAAVEPASRAPAASWNLHFYAVPGSDGTSLFVSTGQIGQLGSTVYATADRGSAMDRDRFGMAYDQEEQAYNCMFDAFFDPGPSTVEGSIRITTTISTERNLSEGPVLDTGPVDYKRYFVPTTGAPELASDDQLLRLTLNDHSLPVDAYAIVMSANSPPKPPPAGHSFIGQTYSARASGAIITTTQPMLLNLGYTPLSLGDTDPHTLSIFAWDPVLKEWRDRRGDLDSGIGQQLSLLTDRFTVYGLMATTRWRDIFTDYTGLSERSSVTVLFPNGELALDGTSYSGIAVSRAITPTSSSMEWGSIYYTSTVPAGTNLVVDILASDDSLLLNDVDNETSLDMLDPAAYPSLKVRAAFSTDSLDDSARLDEWFITWRPTQSVVYLPIVLRR
jgi:hypothetical protein